MIRKGGHNNLLIDLTIIVVTFQIPVEFHSIYRGYFMTAYLLITFNKRVYLDTMPRALAIVIISLVNECNKSDNQ